MSADPPENAACVIKGPYYPVGDVDFECRTHGVIAVLRDPTRFGAGDIRCDEMRCPVGEPEPESTLRCRCVWRGERCTNQATEEDGLCNWCCRTQRSIHRLRQDPRAVAVSDTEVSIGGAGQTHDYDASKTASTAACWYPDSDRTVLGA